MKIRLSEYLAAAFWSLLDSTYLTGIGHDLAVKINTMPDDPVGRVDDGFELYGDLDSLTDQAVDSVRRQLNGEKGVGSIIIDLSAAEVEFLTEELKTVLQ